MQSLREEVSELLSLYADTWDEFEWSSANEDNADEILATESWTFEMLDTLSRLEEKLKQFGDRINKGEKL